MTYTKICNIIEQKFGANQIPSINSNDARVLLQIILLCKNANQLVECLLESNDEDLYWFIWDNAIYDIDDLFDPLPLTQEMKNRYLHGKEAKYNSPFHITPPVSTKRLTLSALDENTAHLLQDEVEKAGDDSVFIRSLNCYDSRMFFSIVRNDTNELVGYIGLTFLEYWGASHSDNTCNLEYYIISKHRRNRFAMEAAKKVVELAFGEKIETFSDNHHDYFMEKSNANIEMIKIMCDCTNQISYKCALSLGFKEEGKLSLINDGNIYYEYILSKSKYDK